MPTTQRQLEANQQNAQHSTGPQSETGKAIAKMNALRTGLTGRTVLLPSESADLYEHHVARFTCDLNPVGDREHELVQTLADTQWRLNRIPSLEAGVYVIGRIRYADMFADQEPNVRLLLIEHHTFLSHARELNNLSIQESRLRRQYTKDLAELKQLQAQRSEAAKALSQQPKLAISDPALGFEFAAPASTPLSALSSCPTATATSGVTVAATPHSQASGR